MRVCFGAILLLALFGTSCSDACKALADQICLCEGTEVEQRSCLTGVSNRAIERVPSDAEIAVCEQHIETCDCDALAIGDIASCGLSAE